MMTTVVWGLHEIPIKAVSKEIAEQEDPQNIICGEATGFRQ